MQVGVGWRRRNQPLSGFISRAVITKHVTARSRDLDCFARSFGRGLWGWASKGDTYHNRSRRSAFQDRVCPTTDRPTISWSIQVYVVVRDLKQAVVAGETRRFSMEFHLLNLRFIAQESYQLCQYADKWFPCWVMQQAKTWILTRWRSQVLCDSEASKFRFGQREIDLSVDQISRLYMLRQRYYQSDLFTLGWTRSQFFNFVGATYIANGAILGK